MNPTLKIAVVVVSCALTAYSLGVISAQRRKILTPFILAALTTGIALDAVSTILMILGSRHIPITVHGLLGYSAFTLMLIDTILLWRLRNRNRMRQPLPHGVHVYTRCAYLFWVGAYLAGGFLAMHGLK